MRTPSARARKIAGLSAAPVAILVAGVLVWQGSTAAFTATIRNDDNSWQTGQVTLTDDDAGAAMFTVTGLVPGQTGENCIVVTNESTVPGQVRTYLADLQTSPAGLENHLTLGLERGTGGSFGNCTGFTPVDPASALTAGSLATVAGTHRDYASGGAAWDTTGAASATYRVRWEFDTTGLDQTQVNDLQGATTGVDVVWELQNDAPTS